MRSSRSGPPDAVLETRFPWLAAQPFAHRGLHGLGLPENSRAAFAEAIRAGHGIELDVRLSRDGFAVVFHDADLERLTGAPGRLSGRTLAELGDLRLAGTTDGIDALRDTLAFVARRAPLLIELKTDDDPQVAARLCMSVRHALEGYRGHAAVMSFDARVSAWFAEHARHVPRGLVVGGPARGLRSLHDLLSLRPRLLDVRARPHFIAHDVRALPSPLAARMRRSRRPVLAWTVRSAADHARASAHADQIIYES